MKFKDWLWDFLVCHRTNSDLVFLAEFFDIGTGAVLH